MKKIIAALLVLATACYAQLLPIGIDMSQYTATLNAGLSSKLGTNALTQTAGTNTDLVMSQNAVTEAVTNLQGQINLLENPANGLTQAVADERYSKYGILQGVNLFSGTNAPVQYGYDGAAFTNAVAHAVANDLITLGVGTYDLGNIIWTNPVGQITIRGSGIYTTTLKANGFYFHHSVSTNMRMSDMKITQPVDTGADLFFWRFDSTNFNGCTLERLWISGNSTNSYHTYQNAGIKVREKDLITDSIGWHSHVFKGGDDFVSVNPISKMGKSGESMLIKSAGSGLGGNVTGAVIIGAILDGPVSIQAADSNTEISNVAYYNTHFTCTNPASNGFIIGDGSNGGTNNSARNILIDGVSGGDLSTVVYCLYVDYLENITLRNSSVISSNIWGESSVLSKTNIVISAASVPDFSSSCDGDTTWGHRYGSRSIPAVEAGVISNQVRCAEVINSNFYAIAKVGYDIGVTNLAVNDPIWITGGTMSGVYNLIGWGTVMTNDDPIAGAVANDFYITMATTATNQPVAVGTFHVLPGKVGWMLQGAEANYWMSSGEASSKARSSVSLSSGGYSSSKEAWHAWHNSTFGTSLVYDSTNNVTSTYVSALAHVFVKDRAIYCGVFGGPASNVSWIPSYLYTIELSFDLNSDRKSVRTLKVNTLP